MAGWYGIEDHIAGTGGAADRLARVQVELSIMTLLTRLPGLALAVPVGELPWRHDRINGGMEAFPVVWREGV